jgi:hypothetical protein
MWDESDHSARSRIVSDRHVKEDPRPVAPRGEQVQHALCHSVGSRHRDELPQKHRRICPWLLIRDLGSIENGYRYG